MNFYDLYLYRRQREQADRANRPGRQGQATVGHLFLTRPALTKSNPYFDSSVTFDGDGIATTSTFFHYGVSTWGGGDIYGDEG